MIKGNYLIIISVSLILVVTGVPVPEDTTTVSNTPKMIMVTESAAQVIREAVSESPEVAKALQGDSAQQLYLLKTVSYSTGTAADLDIPPESISPDGLPDRIEETDVTLYGSPSSRNVKKEDDPVSLPSKLQIIPIAV